MFAQLMPQLPIKLDGDIFLNDFLLMMDNYSKDQPLGAAPNSYLQAKLQEYKLEIQMFCGNDQQIKITLDQIRGRNWDSANFKQWGIDINKWLNELEKKINHRSEFLEWIEINKQDDKIEKLRSSKFIL